jgi:hypothetical protein
MLRIFVVEDVQRAIVDPVFAKELLGRSTGRSAGSPEKRDSRHRSHRPVGAGLGRTRSEACRRRGGQDARPASLGRSKRIARTLRCGGGVRDHGARVQPKSSQRACVGSVTATAPSSQTWLRSSFRLPRSARADAGVQTILNHLDRRPADLEPQRRSRLPPTAIGRSGNSRAVDASRRRRAEPTIRAGRSARGRVTLTG